MVARRIRATLVAALALWQQDQARGMVGDTVGFEHRDGDRQLYNLQSGKAEWIATLPDKEDIRAVRRKIVSACTRDDEFGVFSTDTSSEEHFPKKGFVFFDCDPSIVHDEHGPLAALLNDGDVEAFTENFEIQITASQSNPPWGLDRVDQKDLPLSKSYESMWDGTGVNVYVVDTGTVGGHEDYSSRYTHGKDFVNENDSHDDLNGHGTHCTGTVGGNTYGVAKGANLLGVKVLRGSGSGSSRDVISGVNWAVQNQRDKFGGASAVISMSLGGGKSDASNAAVSDAAAAGMIVVVAAGNSRADACNYSPASAGGNAREGGVITVMSSDNNDRRSGFSNYGSCTDIIAPGTNILSSWLLGSPHNGKRIISGTSMATPHVAGIAATLLHKHGGDKMAAQNELLSVAVAGRISDAKEAEGSQNLLAQVSSYTGPPTVAPTRPPTTPQPNFCVGSFCPQFILSRFGDALPTSARFGADLALPEGANAFDACAPLDAGSVAGKAVIVRRGSCSFYSKVINAQKGGAAFVIIYNNIPGSDPFEPIYYGDPVGIEVVSGMVGYEDGQELIRKAGQQAQWGRPDMTVPPTMPPTPYPTQKPTTAQPTKTPTTTPPTLEPTTAPTRPCSSFSVRECKRVRDRCVKYRMPVESEGSGRLLQGDEHDEESRALARKPKGKLVCIAPEDIPTQPPTLAPDVYTPDECIKNNYRSATKICKKERKKVCSLANLEGQQAPSPECGFDDAYVWTSDKCGRKAYMLYRATDGAQVCSSFKFKGGAVRCC